ncbi:unnamed protein product [Cuscuta campestris]|nr:unnamed protein product [Cuscuta campestris]
MSGWVAGPAYRGLSRGVLDSLPVVSFAAEHARKFSECPICLTEYSAGEKLRVLPVCCHGFHARCVDVWLVSRASCPSCRRLVVAPAEGLALHKELPV